MDRHTAPAQRMQGVLAVVLTSILWGTTGTAATFAPEVSSIAIGAGAMGIAGLLLALVAVRSLLCDRVQLRAQWRSILLAGIAIMVYPLAFYTSMHEAGVVIGSIVSLASAPIAAGMIEWLALRIVPTARWMLATVLSILGSCILVLVGAHGEALQEQNVGRGILLGLIAGAAYAIYSIAVAQLMAGGVRRASAMGATFGLGGLLLMPVLLLTGGAILQSAQNALVVGYMALVPMFLGYYLFGIGLAYVKASEATTITLLEPAVATLLAVLILGERLGVLGWFGVLLFAVALLCFSGVGGASSSKA